jgi:hypothetical protein
MFDSEHAVTQADQKGNAMPSEQMQKFNQFYESARHNDALDERTAVLLHLGAAMSLGCEP